MTAENDMIPTQGDHRGVPFHAGQSAARLKDVRRDVDAAFALDGVEALFDFAADCTKAPEARLLAAALLRARHDAAVAAREVRPDTDLVRVTAVVAGLNSLGWRHPSQYGSMLDGGRGIPRERPLTVAQRSD